MSSPECAIERDYNSGRLDNFLYLTLVFLFVRPRSTLTSSDDITVKIK